MTPFAIFAFIGVPVIVVALGWGAVLLAERDGKRRRAQSDAFWARMSQPTHRKDDGA